MTFPKPIPKTELPGMTAREREFTARLKDRFEHLEQKFHEKPRNLYTYERAEAHALEWCLEVIREYHEHINVCDTISRVPTVKVQFGEPFTD